MNDEAAQLAAFEQLAAAEAAKQPVAEAQQAAEILEPKPRSEVNIEAILDVPVTLSMEVGRVRIPIRNLLQLTQGSVVELERGADEPLDVFVNGTLIAHGEVVVVNDKFGVRITDVISPAERIRKLK
ncbi:MAG: flagellar motor switch protein FliN [Sinobacteraceae bacterium]|nr:flagellar motor switch protein FliN [Nevskiaceae bacterium]MCP5339090.1 flagellar motor switch protein FliN [Nevskiaceae bacterium]MCP5359999.1 flagellar motor switch protein FliN [Nevskiaceae bacterium]MCP5466929.1 flagellar motor switch protein FliN [Nevskiaceae bacterium]MCP5472181.1 flagellar motor switch protein FliN [Nevskiaceae bacterium]